MTNVSYTYDEWAALCSEVERQGGALLPAQDRCVGRPVTFPVPDSTQTTKDQTCHCNNQSMFVTIYDPSDDAKEAKDMRKRGGGFARVCGVCDYLGAWPIFAHVLETEEEA